MEKETTKKVVTMSFLVAGLLAYLSVSVLFKALAGSFGPVQKLYSIDLLAHGLPILSFLLVFGLLQFRPAAVTWAEEVILELAKVVFPSGKDTSAMTLVVCVMVAISSGILFFFDTMARAFVEWIVSF
jgi:preprotein translocase subunit SecE